MMSALSVHTTRFAVRCAGTARTAVAVLAAVLLAGATAGCDLSGADDNADLPRLEGTWRVADLTVDGISVKGRLDAQYRSLVLIFREDGSGVQQFDVFGDATDSEDNLQAGGRFDLESDDAELLLLPDSFRPFTLDYTFTGPSEVTFSADDEDAEDLLQYLGLSLRGDIDELTLTAVLDG